MAEPKETPIDPDVPDQESMDEFDALTSAFQDHMDEFAREHDLNYSVLSLLSLRMSLSARMLDYVTEVEKPSGSGLKLQLDRFRRDVDEIVRLARKGADEFVATAKEALAQAESDEQPE